VNGQVSAVVPFPPYLPFLDYCRLSYPAQQKVKELLLNPPSDTAGYLKRKDRFTALGYHSMQHFLVSRYLEHLEYDSEGNESDPDTTAPDAPGSDAPGSDATSDSEEQDTPLQIELADRIRKLASERTEGWN